MHIRLQDGRIVTVAEMVLQHTSVYDFAHELIRCFDLKGERGKPRNVEVVYQDPANKSQTGTGHSVRDQINDVLAEVGMGAIDGSNDRIGGWQTLYQMLARGQWLIADTCELLIAAIPSRVHDPKKPGDLLKVGGDPLDDVMDSARYGLYSWVMAAEKPFEVRRAEMISQFAPQLNDETLSYRERNAIATSSLIRHMQLKQEQEWRGAPARIGRLGRR